MIENLFKALAFGITLAIAIGPIALLIINYGINSGTKSALLSGLGAALGDFLFAIFSFSIGSALIDQLNNYELAFNISCSLILIAFGMWIAVSAIRTTQDTGLRSNTFSSNPLLLTFGLTVMNPLTVLAFTSFTSNLKIDDWSDVLITASAIFAGSFLVQGCLAIFSSNLRGSLVNKKSIKYLNIISGLGIAIFGLFGVLKN